MARAPLLKSCNTTITGLGGRGQQLPGLCSSAQLEGGVASATCPKRRVPATRAALSCGSRPAQPGLARIWLPAQRGAWPAARTAPSGQTRTRWFRKELHKRHLRGGEEDGRTKKKQTDQSVGLRLLKESQKAPWRRQRRNRGHGGCKDAVGSGMVQATVWHGKRGKIKGVPMIF